MTEQKLNYRRISKKIAGKLSLLEAYAFYCLAMKSDFNTMESHITQENLAAFYGINKTDQIRKYLNKMKESGLVDIIPQNINGQFGKFRKNTYKLKDDDFFWLTIQLHEESIKRELKGFLILLRCLCFSTTLECRYNQATIAAKLGLSKSTISRQMKQAIEHGYVEEEKEKGCYRLLRQDIFIPLKRTDEDVSKIIMHKADIRHKKKREEAKRTNEGFII